MVSNTIVFFFTVFIGVAGRIGANITNLIFTKLNDFASVILDIEIEELIYRRTIYLGGLPTALI